MSQTSHTLTVATFNLKSDQKHARRHRWSDRKYAAAQMILQSGAAIIGVQELLPKMKEDVQTLLRNYSVLGEGRYSGAKPSLDEHSDIIVQNQRFTVSYHTTFWLSKTPLQQASRAYFSIFPRICTVAEMMEKNTGKRIRVFNTHFDHICFPARVLGVRLILQYMSCFNQTDPLPTILMGDFNAKSNSRPLQILRNNLHSYSNVHLNDVYAAIDAHLLSNTYHGFKAKEKAGASPIDYIFVSDEFEVVDVRIQTDKVNGEFPSDHYPILATLKLK